MAKYNCPSLGDCEKANATEVFERFPGEDLKCPVCGAALVAVPSAPVRTGKTALPFIVAGVVVVALASAGGYAYKRHASGKAEHEAGAVASAAASPSASPAAPAVPAAATVLVAATVPAAAAPSSAAVLAASSQAQATGTGTVISTGAGAAPASGIAPPDAETRELRRQGESSLVRGDAVQAESASSKAAANEMLKLAIAKMGQGKYDEAEKDLAEAGARDPKGSLAYYNMGILRLKQGQAEDALKQFEASFMAGFSYFDKMDQDHDLDALRKDPRFTKLVDTYRAQAK